MFGWEMLEVKHD
jgi:hypothetical protein